MAVVSKSIHLNISTDKVFAYLIDLERHIEWSGECSFGLEKIRIVTPEPLQPGSVFKSTGRLSSKAGVEDTSTITEVQPHSRLAWETVSDGAGQQNTFQWAYTLKPQNDGTELTYSLLERRFNPKPIQLWFPPFLWLVDRKVFGKEMTTGLKKIKEVMEQTGFTHS
jgi:hypothetical protein